MSTDKFDRGDKVALGVGLVMAAMLALFLVGYFALVFFVIGGKRGNPFVRLGRGIREAVTLLADPGISMGESGLEVEFRWQERYEDGDYEAAADELRKALPFYLGDLDNEAAARVYTNLGCTYHQLGDAERALEEYISATHQFYAAGQELADQGILLANIRLLGEQQGEEWLRARSLEWLSSEKAGELLAEVADAAAVEEPAVEPLFPAYDPEQMLETWRSSADSCLRAGDSLTAAHFLNTAGYTFTGMENPDSALGYHRRALALFERHAEPLTVAGGHVAVAGTFAAFGQPDSALVEYLKAHDAYEATGDPEMMALVGWWLQPCLEQLGEERFSAVCRDAGRDPGPLLKLAREAEQPVTGG